MSWFSELIKIMFPPERDLDELAKSRREPLDYNDSVVDLLKTIGKDSSFESRRDLAGKYGRPEYSGTADDNEWLHKEIMKRR